MHLNLIDNWMSTWLIKINSDKSVPLILKQSDPPSLYFPETPVSIFRSQISRNYAQQKINLVRSLKIKKKSAEQLVTPSSPNNKVKTLDLSQNNFIQFTTKTHMGKQNSNLGLCKIITIQAFQSITLCILTLALWQVSNNTLLTDQRI